jgi:hypothetical protein
MAKDSSRRGKKERNVIGKTTETIESITKATDAMETLVKSVSSLIGLVGVGLISLMSYGGCKAPTPPQPFITNFYYSLSNTAIGVWKWTRGGDKDIDSKKNKTTAVQCRTSIINYTNKVTMDIYYVCSETEKNFTQFMGTNTYTIYIPPAGFIVTNIQCLGGNTFSARDDFREEKWKFSPFKIAGSYWDKLEYLADTKKTDDEPYVGVRGDLHFTACCTPIENVR